MTLLETSKEERSWVILFGGVAAVRVAGGEKEDLAKDLWSGARDSVPDTTSDRQ